MNEVKIRASVIQAPESRKAGDLDITRVQVAGKVELPGGFTRVFYETVTAFKGLAGVASRLKVGDVVDVIGSLNYRRTDDGKEFYDINALSIEKLAGTFTVVADKKGQPVLQDAQNSVTLLGNLTRDVRSFKTEKGNAGAAGTVAVDAGERKYPHFLPFVAWGGVAETSADLRKGARVRVEGAVFRSTDTDREGNQRFKLEVTASSVQAYVRNTNTGEGAAAQAASEQPAPPPQGDDIDDLEAEDLPF